MKRILFITLFLVFFLKPESYPCTIVMVSDSMVTFAGSNEDAAFPLTLLWCIPATKGNYGRICLGYKMLMNSVQGGMNEKGLFVDGNALPRQGWKADENKKTMFGSLLDRLLATCASVEEVKEFFNTYNTPGLDQARIPVMDSSGASMIVEWYDGKVVFLESEKPYQIATNFVGSKYVDRPKPGWRYNKANEILQDKQRFSLKIVREALEATHQESTFSSTVYSFICDLKKGLLYVYNYHDFSNPVKFTIEEEIRGGYKEYYLSHLFPERKENYQRFIAEGPVNMIMTGYNRISKTMAMTFYHILKYQYPKAFDRNIDINVLSRVGEDLISQNHTEDAITFLEKNTTEFPDSARVHFELANAYANTDNKEKAVAEYEKTLEINPGHKEARHALEKLLDKY